MMCLSMSYPNKKEKGGLSYIFQKLEQEKHKWLVLGHRKVIKRIVMHLANNLKGRHKATGGCSCPHPLQSIM